MAPADSPHSPDSSWADEAAWDEVEQELGDLVSGFQALQDDLNYRHAQDSLHHLIQRLRLSPREQAGLEEAAASLQGLLHKLDQGVVHIAVFGLVGRGKSSLLNALVGQPLFATGPLHGVTQQVTGVGWEPIDGCQRVSLPGLGQSRIELIDTPGLDEVDGQQRAELAQRVARQVDLILFVVAGDITQAEYDALCTLRQASKPMLLVFNKTDQYPEADRDAIYRTLRDQRLQNLISPEEIVLAAAAPLVAELITRPDGSQTPELRRGTPQVEDLKLKILTVLQREGKALVALNTLLYADAVSQQIVERKRQICDRIAEDTIWNAVMIKAMAVALNPITLADLFSGAVIDVALIVALSRLYGLPMDQGSALKLLRQIALGLGGLSASELMITLGLSSLKGVLGLSAAATGGLTLAPYVPVALTQAAVAGVFTYSTGHITQTYLANGANWGPDGPHAVVHQILDSLDEASILHRVKAELQDRLGLGQRQGG